MIPDFNEDGFLPEGIHDVTLAEFKDRFVIFDQSDRRLRIFDGLKKLLEEAKSTGIVKRVLVAGSYVSAKPQPNDFDCLLVLDQSIVTRNLRPSEYRLVSRRMARQFFRGDIVPVLEGSTALAEYLEFFQTSRSGKRMGIVEIEL